ncbi:GNAT family N-acetyltransferase [Rosistilla oblonga]|uniref:GNAT family N-acetyltransferase n=1 Tax=Rosistilla oblonga TaxID=2527990 RepID=UPI003A984E21
MNDLEIRPPRPEESPQIVNLLTAGESEMRRHLITSSVAGALKNPDATTIGLVAARGENLVGAAIASALPGGTAVLVGLRIAAEELDADESNAAAIAEPLFKATLGYLHTLGANFIQSTCATESAPKELSAVGFQHLADLQYLSAEAATMPDTASPDLEFIAAADLPEGELVELVAQTYIDTRDCPSMSQYRSAAETLASYQAMPQYDPAAWRIAKQDGKPIGCVLTMPFADSNALELTYMGIVPDARGNRWGEALVAEAARIARERSLQTINLGVDRDNAPAQTVYERFGFTPFYGEAVWGLRIDPA